MAEPLPLEARSVPKGGAKSPKADDSNRSERPLDRTPNEETVEAIEAGRRGEVETFDTLDAFWDSLNAED